MFSLRSGLLAGALAFAGSALADSRSADVWLSRTVEQVTDGRSVTTLDQTFELSSLSSHPQIVVHSSGRVGRQSFPAQLAEDGPSSPECRALTSAPAC